MRPMPIARAIRFQRRYTRLAELAQNLLETPKESEESAILADQIDKLVGLAARCELAPLELEQLDRVQ